jgi:hypothetical protein
MELNKQLRNYLKLTKQHLFNEQLIDVEDDMDRGARIIGQSRDPKMVNKD